MTEIEQKLAKLTEQVADLSANEDTRAGKLDKLAEKVEAGIKFHVHNLPKGQTSWGIPIQQEEPTAPLGSDCNSKGYSTTEFEQAKIGGIKDKEFRMLLDLCMCSDPWPLEDSENKMFTDMLDSEAQKRGYDEWVIAYHEFKPDCDTEGMKQDVADLSGAVSDLEQAVFPIAEPEGMKQEAPPAYHSACSKCGELFWTEHGMDNICEDCFTKEVEAEGSWICQECGKDWGDGSGLWCSKKPKTPGGGLYSCHNSFTHEGCLEVAVKWIPKDPECEDETGSGHCYHDGKCMRCGREQFPTEPGRQSGTFASPKEPEPPEIELSEGEGNALLALIDTFGREQKEKLLRKMRDGWRGWADTEYGDIIYQKFIDHAHKAKTREDYIDVANFAAFLWHQDYTPEPPELKPCPFCGNGGQVIDYNAADSLEIMERVYRVECGKCWSNGADCDTEAEAIAAWNQRAEEKENLKLKAEKECEIERILVLEAENERLKEKVDDWYKLACQNSKDSYKFESALKTAQEKIERYEEALNEVLMTGNMDVAWDKAKDALKDKETK